MDMQPTLSPSRGRPYDTAPQKAAALCRVSFAVAAMVTLSACEQNSFVPPPPPKVEVAVPVRRPITRFLEATGNAAPIKNVDLEAKP